MGRITYIDKCLSVYRVHNDGIWNSRRSLDKLISTLDFYHFIFVSLDLTNEEHKIILNRNQYWNMKLLGFYLGNLNILLAFKRGIMIFREFKITQLIKKHNVKAFLDGLISSNK
jgi:hypothetical protein